MRHPNTWAALAVALLAASLVAIAVGLGAIFAADLYHPVDPMMQGVAAIGGLVGAYALILGLNAVVRAKDAARLSSGRDLVAHWRISARDWANFLADDEARRNVTGLRNRLRPSRRAEEDGFEILLGRNALLCDGACHNLRTGGIANLLGGELREVSWVNGSGHALEFLRVYLGGDSYKKADVLRMPIPPDARAQAEAAQNHFRARLSPERRRATRAHYLPGVANSDEGPVR
jgi:hypothetical protein